MIGKLMIEINGEALEVTNSRENSLDLADGTEWVIFQDNEDAGREAREYWKDMAENDPSEFTCIVGEKALVAWALGQNYAPGAIGVNSLEEWLDLHLDCPEEHFASYDGLEVDCRINGNLQSELGLQSQCVCYRTN